jgi:hypothetical protein
MNLIHKRPLHTIGYQFIAPEYLPEGKDEYHLRNTQNRNGISYRHLSAYEIESLVRNNNTSDDWNKILVSDAFNAELVKNCKFFGLVRIGKLEPWYLEFHNLRLPVGLYNSTIISSDLGDNVVINNVNYLSHYILGNEVMVVNVNELATTSVSKFGNGIIKDGEQENIRIWLEVCNENAGRGILPFNGMLPGDAYLWAKFRDDEELMNKFKAFTEKKFDRQRGYYGKVGDRTVIKNCKIVKDVWIGSDAYLKGANKIKNVTLNSSADAKTQVGEGCELVNGIVGYGCRIFYGVKAVRFFMASHSQLKYGARLINSYLGNNSTISCCEVLNTLIYPFHEQHHNNSFLCAALIMGQTNMAAGATIGSNHNSRSPDGELVAGRGFWPGLCVSLKHNSKFASFTILAKGDYPAELNIPVPFSLVSNEQSKDELIVLPGYWFMYNLYALTRNEWKYQARDARTEKIQALELSYLAPDSINEMFSSLSLFAEYTGRAWYAKFHPEEKISAGDFVKKGRSLLEAQDKIIDELEIVAEGFENSNRKAVLIKVRKAYAVFKQLIRLYGIEELASQLRKNKIRNISDAALSLPWNAKRNEWLNIGGQLIAKDQVDKMKAAIRNGKIEDWDKLHEFYVAQGESYADQKFRHAFASLVEIAGIKKKDFTPTFLSSLIKESVATRTWIVDGIFQSREKDYTNPFRQMVFENEAEMQKVVGKLDDNSFISMKREELEEIKKDAAKLLRQIKA